MFMSITRLRNPEKLNNILISISPTLRSSDLKQEYTACLSYLILSCEQIKVKDSKRCSQNFFAQTIKLLSSQQIAVIGNIE